MYFKQPSLALETSNGHRDAIKLASRCPLCVATMAPFVDNRNWPTPGGHKRQLPGPESRIDEAWLSGSFREARRTAVGRFGEFNPDGSGRLPQKVGVTPQLFAL
jgi:hypothetical protein